MRSASDTDDDHLTDAADAAVDLDMLPELIGYALRRAQLAVFQDFHDSCAAEDIRTAQYAVLHLLRRNPGARQGQVGAALGIKRTNFVPLLDELARRGLAERRGVPGDRRAKGLWLTARGDALLTRLDRLVAAHEARLVARIGADGKRQLLGLLRLLADPAA
jgi:DNA-binding MarR family transcriptional regulator